MRRLIIIYGVSVLVILSAIAIATFWVLSRRAPQSRPAMSPSFVRELASAETTERDRLLEEALDAGHEVSMYSPDGALLATNVRPPVPRPANLPLSSLAPPHLEPPTGLAVPSPSSDGLRRTRPEPFLFPEPARARPAKFSYEDAEVVMRPRAPTIPAAPFAIALLVALALLVLLSFPVTAALTRRLERLAEVARRFGQGELTQRADASGTDEVSRTAAAFNAMAEQIADLRVRERELLANVSHELRTPMARMAVALELTEANPVEATRYLGELARDLRELETLLESIIDTFRLDLASPRARQSWPVERTSLDLRALVEEIASDFRARQSEHVFHVDLPPKAIPSIVDRTLVRRATMNLLDNARKYSPPGSEIRLVLEEGGAILVRDQGRGIEQDDLPHVFEPFFRADRSRARGTRGLGLGLTFVKLVASLHQGQVSVESKPGQGSTFRLSLGLRASNSTAS